MLAVAIKLYVVNASHPCATIEKALELKGLDYKIREWPPPFHAAAQKAVFGKRTVPGIKLDGKKVVGSLPIMRALDERVPQPRLFTDDPAVTAAAEWGDGDFQQLARDVLWAGFKHKPAALVSYTEHSKIPLPAPIVRLNAPIIIRAQRGLNKTNDEVGARRLQELPALLDKIDAWIAAGTIGDAEHPNAADLEIFSTVRLLSTVADVRPLLDGRPCDKAARALFPQYDGELPAGALSAA
jgi:glutathione S-transferase